MSDRPRASKTLRPSRPMPVPRLELRGGRTCAISSYAALSSPVLLTGDGGRVRWGFWSCFELWFLISGFHAVLFMLKRAMEELLANSSLE